MRALALVAAAAAVLAVPSASDPASTFPQLIAAGDVASCGSSGDEATARLLDGLRGTIVVLGDSVYERGSDDEYRRCYAPSWGRHRARTRPAVGNHEYGTPGAAGYFRYFGAAAAPPRGWYSFDLAGWHVVVQLELRARGRLRGGLAAGALAPRDLAAHPVRAPSRRCTIRGSAPASTGAT